MANSERMILLSRIVAPISSRVIKISGRWFVADLERPGQTIPGPMFKRKSDALAFASAYAHAVWARIKGE